MLQSEHIPYFYRGEEWRAANNRSIEVEANSKSKRNWGMKSRDNVVIISLLCSILLKEGIENWLVKWVVLNGMGSITLHSIPSLFYKTK